MKVLFTLRGRDERKRKRREAFGFYLTISLALIALVALGFLYDRLPWVRHLLGDHSGSIKLGVWVLASPLIVALYLLEKFRK